MADSVRIAGAFSPTERSRLAPPPIQPSIHPARRGLRFLLDVHHGPLEYFTALMEQEGPFAWLRLRGQLLLMLNDAEAIRYILEANAHNYKKARFNSVLKPLLGQGIFLSETDLWRKQRREAAPVFANGNFDDMTAEMVAAVEAMFGRWEPRIDRGETIDIPLEMMWLALDVLLRALFHDRREDIALKMQTALGLLLGEAEGRIWSAVRLPQRLVLARKKYRNAMGFIDGLIHSLIDARRRDKAYPEDLLSRLIENYSPSRKDQTMLRHQLVSFLLAGHETTAHSLSWSLYLLSQHHPERRRLIEEVDDVLGKRPPAFRDIKDLVYVRQVFDEALRLYPPVWTMSRETLGEDVIPLEDGRRIALPAEAAVMLCTYAVHRRSTYWEHPATFDPDRFAPEVSACRPKLAWMPFGGGGRLCLGFRFAQIEAITALSMIAQRYSLTLVPGQRVSPQPIITLRPSGPILFRVERRSTISRNAEAHPRRYETELGDTSRFMAAGTCPFGHHA